MLVVKVELHSAIDGRTEELGRLVIANDGTGSRTRGNYDVVALRKGQEYDRRAMGLAVMGHEEKAVTRRARVDGYQRVSKPVWDLVAKALGGLDYG